MEYISKNLEQTIKFAKSYAKSLNPGDIVLLDGDLGAGKTMFTKGIVDYFSNGKDSAISPTFTIVNEYSCNPPIYHFDFYRIKNEEELLAIGIEEYLFSNGICIIEWPERAPNLLQNIKCKKVEIIKENDYRIIRY